MRMAGRKEQGSWSREQGAGSRVGIRGMNHGPWTMNLQRISNG